ncbi:MAG: ASCH domain-containing protein [Bacillota bacterium]
MKAITLWQPWASLVAIGSKKIETRSWATKYRGPLAIHAAAKTPGDSIIACFHEPFATVLKNAGFVRGKNISLPCGVVIATCRLVDCVTITPEFVATLSEQERAFGDYTQGRYAWILDNVRRLERPVPANGRQRLWELDERILELAGVD